MDVFTAIGMIQMMCGFIQNVYQLQQTVVKHKKEVKEFAIFIIRIDEKLKRQESHWQQRSRDQTLPRDVASSLYQLFELLETSMSLMQELQSYLSKTNASRRIKELQKEINGIRLDIAFNMHFPDQQTGNQHQQLGVFPRSSALSLVPYGDPQLPGPSSPPPSCDSILQTSFQNSGTVTPSSYAPDHVGVVNIQYNIHHHHYHGAPRR